MGDDLGDQCLAGFRGDARIDQEHIFGMADGSEVFHCPHRIGHGDVVAFREGIRNPQILFAKFQGFPGHIQGIAPEFLFARRNRHPHQGLRRSILQELKFANPPKYQVGGHPGRALETHQLLSIGQVSFIENGRVRYAS